MQNQMKPRYTLYIHMCYICILYSGYTHICLCILYLQRNAMLPVTQGFESGTEWFRCFGLDPDRVFKFLRFQNPASM